MATFEAAMTYDPTTRFQAAAVENAMIDLMEQVMQAGHDFAAGEVWQEEDSLLWSDYEEGGARSWARS